MCVTFTVFYLCAQSNVHLRSEEMFYQLALMQFGNYRRLKLDPPPPLRTLLRLAVDAEPGTEKSGLSKNEIVDVSVSCYLENRAELMDDHPQRISSTLLTRRGMLAEYFEIIITPDGEIESLPHLMKEYTPDLNKLPVFLMRLGPQVRHLSSWMKLMVERNGSLGTMAIGERMLPYTHARARTLLFAIAIAFHA